MEKTRDYLTINKQAGDVFGIRGEIITFMADPFINDPQECYNHIKDGLIIIQDGIILEVDNYEDIYEYYNHELTHIDHHKDAVIMSGFIDCHTHYVQSAMLGSYGGTLLNWLEKYTFPAEIQFKDPNFAQTVARIFMRQLLEQGTTTANVLSTTFAGSVDAFFEESSRYNTRMITGKVLQDRNLPDELKDQDTIESIEISRQLIDKWHNKGRQLYSIIPRFAPTSTNLQLKLAGELYQDHKHQGVYMHTHLNEFEGEIKWVEELFPKFSNYAKVYDAFGLLDNNSIMAHCCLMKPEEWGLLHRRGVAVAHCPCSNQFLGDGAFKYWQAKDSLSPLRLGLATDVGGGTNFSVVRQLGAAYNIGMMNSHAMNPVQSFYLATRGGAEVLNLQDKIGSLATGYEADIAVLDLCASEFVEWRLQFSDNIFDKLFALACLSLDNMNRVTYVAGKKVYQRDRVGKFKYASEL